MDSWYWLAETPIDSHPRQRREFGKSTKKGNSDKCRPCDIEVENVNNINKDCRIFAQKECNLRQDKSVPHLHLCKFRNNELEVEQKWYRQKTAKLSQNNQVKILWDYIMQTYRIQTKHNRCWRKKCPLTDVAFHGGYKIKAKECGTLTSVFQVITGSLGSRVFVFKCRSCIMRVFHQFVFAEYLQNQTFEAVLY